MKSLAEILNSVFSRKESTYGIVIVKVANGKIEIETKSGYGNSDICGSIAIHQPIVAVEVELVNRNNRRAITSTVIGDYGGRYPTAMFYNGARIISINEKIGKIVVEVNI